jgi:hypothetical protein
LLAVLLPCREKAVGFVDYIEERTHFVGPLKSKLEKFRLDAPASHVGYRGIR